MQLQWKREWTIPTVVGVVSFGIGAGVGFAVREYIDWRSYRFIRERLDRMEADKDQLEIDLSGELDHVMPCTVRYSDDAIKNSEAPYDQELYDVEELERSMEDHPSNGSVLEPEPEVQSIFPDVEEDWDYEQELQTRTPERPYIIHKDEYDENDGTFSQSTLTYYQGDDVLTDEHETPIYNYQTVASPLTFGKGSQDPSIVFIRNERLEAEYEVIIDHGYYAVEVLGEEIEHSFDKKAPLPKFKQE